MRRLLHKHCPPHRYELVATKDQTLEYPVVGRWRWKKDRLKLWMMVCSECGKIIRGEL